MSHSVRSESGPKRWALTLTAAVVVLATMLASAAGAEAKRLGETTLKPNAATFEALSDLGVAVSPTGPAKATRKGIAFPITGAKLDDDLTGRIEHKGGLKFAGMGAKLKVKNFVVKLGERKAKLFADAGGDSIRLLDLNLKKAKVRNGGSTVKGIRAKLAKPAAEALSATFGTEIPKGTPIGRVTVAFK